MKTTSLSRFTPSLMRQEALEAIFVQREPLAQRLVELIRDSTLTAAKPHTLVVGPHGIGKAHLTPTAAKHHTLLIGPRGIGKTHLISLVYHRIRAADDLRGRLLIAWLREEEWGVASFLDLLLRIFRALLAEHADPTLAERVEAIYDLPPDAAERAGAQLLKQYIGDRTLLLLIENLDDLFDGMGDQGQKQLRAYLQENPFCTILASAQSLFNGVSLQTSPFYGFFRVQHLSELNIDDAARLLANIALLEDDQELAAFIQSPTGHARVRAIHHLAGGNPRVYVIFSQFLTLGSLDALVEPLMRTLDDLTPYYQARMAWLSPQQRKIMDLLYDRRHAAPVKEIAERCFITHQTASSQLKDLREKGYVRSYPIGRESYYELREPLMRMCFEVKKHRGGPIRLFVDFLRHWFSPGELEQRPALLPPDKAFERKCLIEALQETEPQPDPRAAMPMREYGAYLQQGDFERALCAMEELVAIRGSAWDYANLAYCYSNLGRSTEAIEAYQRATRLEPTNVPAWLGWGWELSRMGRWAEALAPFDKAVESAPENAPVWRCRGLALSYCRRSDEALSFFERAIALDPNDSEAWRYRGTALYDLERWNEALASCDHAIELAPGNAVAWLDRGRVLIRMGRPDEALASCDKAAELGLGWAEIWQVRGAALGSLHRWEEALRSCEAAIEMGDQSAWVCYNRAEFLLALNRWDEGTAALDDALCRFSHSTEPATGDIAAILSNLINAASSTWRARMATLIPLYDRHQVLSALGQGLVRSIPALTSPLISDAAARMWLDLWRQAAGDRAEMRLPLRLLDAAIRYRQDHDPRALLDLPVEERTLLRPLLEVEPGAGSS